MAQKKKEKLILFRNKSKEPVTVFFYRSWDLLCLISWFSKIIQPGEDYLQRENCCFKYQLQLGRKDLKKVKKWSKDLFIRINVLGRVDEDDLDHHKIDKTVSLQHDDHIRAASKAGQKDFYAILGLDIRDVRKMNSIDEQTEAIKEAYVIAMKKYHPDKPG